MNEIQQIAEIDPRPWRDVLLDLWGAVTGFLGYEVTVAIIVLIVLGHFGAFRFWRKKKDG